MKAAQKKQAPDSGPRMRSLFFQTGFFRALACGSRVPLTLLSLASPWRLLAQTRNDPTPTPPALVPPYGELPPTFWEAHAIAVAIGLGTLVLAMLLGWLLCRSRPQKMMSPETQARLALEALRPLPEDGAVLSQVSQIIRRYFSAAFQLAPGEFTTAEFSRSIAEQPHFSAELAAAVIGFLRRCDAQKFSTEPVADPGHSVVRALHLLDQAEAQRTLLSHPTPSPSRDRRP